MKRTASVADWAAGAALLGAVSLAAAVMTGCSGGQERSSQSVSQAAQSAQAVEPAEPRGGRTEAVTATPTGPATVSVSNSGLGDILVGALKHTLYVFDADTTNKSTCSGACAAAWPPVITQGTPRSGTGASGLTLGTTNRTDGKTQVTVNGHPVYYFSGDKKAGDTTGQGLNQFGGKWWVLDSSGQKHTTNGSGSPSPSGSGTQSASPSGAASPSGNQSGY
jgi:predicted lipoprotein with Yx(FWY)xxD motif